MKSYIELFVSELILDFRGRRVKAKQVDLFPVVRSGLELIALRAGVDPHHREAYEFAEGAAKKVFTIAATDKSLAREAQADARQILKSLKNIRRPLRPAS